MTTASAFRGCLRASRCRSRAATQAGRAGVGRRAAAGAAHSPRPRGPSSGTSRGSTTSAAAGSGSPRRCGTSCSTATTRIRDGGHGSARSVSFSRRVPRATRSRFCVHVVTTAAGTRAPEARVWRCRPGLLAPRRSPADERSRLGGADPLAACAFSLKAATPLAALSRGTRGCVPQAEPLTAHPGEAGCAAGGRRWRSAVSLVR
jgi:hypothetical protein